MGPQFSRLPNIDWTRGFLALWIGLVAVLSLAPFGPLITSWKDFDDALVSGIDLSVGWPIWETLIERLLAFLPIGFLLHHYLFRSAARWPALTALSLSAGIALAIEIAQGVVVSRHSRLSDLAFAIIASTLGLSLSRFLLRYPNQRYRLLFAGIFLVASVVAGAVPAFARLGLGISGWDCSYPLILGNELTGDRPWHGSIKGFAIYARALPMTTIRDLAAARTTTWNAETRTAAGALLVSRFGSSPLRTASLASASNPLAGQSARTGDRQIVTVDPVASKAVCKAITRAGEFTVNLVIKSAEPRQFGPARILSMSQDTLHRNFTVGQEAAEIILRVRTPRGGPNGDMLEIRTKPQALTSGWHHVVARYGAEGGSIFVDGVAATPPGRYRNMLILPPFEYRINLGWVIAAVSFGAGASAGLAFAKLGGKALFITAFTGVIVALAVAWSGSSSPFMFLVAAVPPSLGCAAILGSSALLGRYRLVS